MNVTSDRPFDESVVLQLKVACLDPWAEHKRRLAEIFGDGSDKADGETEQPADKEFKADEVAVPVPVFHYSRTAVLARGWSEEMLHRRWCLTITACWSCLLQAMADLTAQPCDPSALGMGSGRMLGREAAWRQEAREATPQETRTAGKAKARPNLRKQNNK